MTLQLPVALYQNLVAHALETPTLEVCGLLGGVGATATQLYRIANMAATPQVAFTMDPQAQLAAMLEMRGRGETLVGIYHSHPTTAAQPSATDLKEAAYPGVAFLIVSLAAPAAPVLAAFAFDGQHFTAMALRLTESARLQSEGCASLSLGSASTPTQ
jgi:proteasome lid subunit RPN8/RPN11